MCVIIYKPSGVKIPSENELFMAHRIHPDGCGFISSSGLHYRGLDYNKFLTLLQMVPLKDECIIHFRFATHGSIKKANCHPFEKNGVWFAHNGVLDITPIGDKTDSETAFLKYVYPMVHDYGVNSQETLRVIGNIIGWSKFAIMVNGKAHLFGRYERYQGRYYSNLRHVEQERTYEGIFAKYWRRA